MYLGSTEPNVCEGLLSILAFQKVEHCSSETSSEVINMTNAHLNPNKTDSRRAEREPLKRHSKPDGTCESLKLHKALLVNGEQISTMQKFFTSQ